MRKDHALAAVVAATIVLNALAAAVRFSMAGESTAPARIEQPDVGPPEVPPAVPILESHELQGILARRFAAQPAKTWVGSSMVVVDRSGQVRAAVIDFGGFLGVGSRKIAVDWDALSFPRPGDRRVVLPSNSRATR